MKARSITKEGSRVTIDQVMKAWDKDQSSTKEEFIKLLNIKKYVPFVQKKMIAEKAMYTAHAIYDEKDEKKARPIEYERDSAREYHANVIAILSSYTDLQLAGSNTFDIYDRLQSVDALRVIFNAIGSDIEEWTRIWGMVREDFMETHFSMQGMVKAQMLGMIADVAAQAANMEP